MSEYIEVKYKLNAIFFALTSTIQIKSAVVEQNPLLISREKQRDVKGKNVSVNQKAERKWTRRLGFVYYWTEEPPIVTSSSRAPWQPQHARSSV